MARQSVITFERVKAAAEELRAAGKQVSVREVRRELGEGSFATINPLLNQVKAEWTVAAETAAKLAATTFPFDLAAAYHHNVEREREAVREVSRQKIEDLRVQVEDAEEAFTGAQAEIEELSAQAARERAEAAEKIRNLEITSGSQRERAAALDEALHQVRGERDGALAEKSLLASEQVRLQLDLKRSDQDLQEARQRAARLEAQVESLQKDLADFAQRAAVAERHAADTESRCEDLKQRCQALEADCRELQGEHRATTARLLETQTALAEEQRRTSLAEAGLSESGKKPGAPAKDARVASVPPSTGSKVDGEGTTSGNGKSRTSTPKPAAPTAP